MTVSEFMVGDIVRLLESIDKRLKSIDERLAGNSTEGFPEVCSALASVEDGIQRVENAVLDLD